MKMKSELFDWTFHISEIDIVNETGQLQAIIKGADIPVREDIGRALLNLCQQLTKAASENRSERIAKIPKPAAETPNVAGVAYRMVEGTTTISKKGDSPAIRDNALKADFKEWIKSMKRVNFDDLHGKSMEDIKQLDIVVMRKQKKKSRAFLMKAAFDRKFGSNAKRLVRLLRAVEAVRKGRNAGTHTTTLRRDGSDLTVYRLNRTKIKSMIVG